MFATLLNLILAPVFALLAMLTPAPTEPAPVLAPAQTIQRPVPRIGGTDVPFGLVCQEDEVIAFDSTQPAPYPLACVHIDNL